MNWFGAKTGDVTKDSFFEAFAKRTGLEAEIFTNPNYENVPILLKLMAGENSPVFYDMRYHMGSDYGELRFSPLKSPFFSVIKIPITHSNGRDVCAYLSSDFDIYRNSNQIAALLQLLDYTHAKIKNINELSESISAKSRG